MLQRRGSRLAGPGWAVVQVGLVTTGPAWCQPAAAFLGVQVFTRVRSAVRGGGQQAGDMGSSHSLGCGKHHIYDKIADPGHHQQQQQAMGARKESIETLDVKISDLDNSSGRGASGEWGGGGGQQFRRREDILYNIFMIETEDTGGRDLGWSWGRAASGEPHYGRLASLDVSLLEPGKREDNYF